MTSGRLVVPEGLVIDEVARERLARQLDRQPPEVVGVAGEVSALDPGTSYRVQAEWKSLEPWSAAAPSTAALRGAALLRDGARFEVVDGLVAVDGPLVVDRGVHVHDPWAPVDPLVDASERGRPPFPRRPVVVFAATGTDPARAQWARRMVNRLVRREVEGRLALPFGSSVPEGLQLTRPCLVGTPSIQALATDVIVALDAGAAAQAAEWCGANRTTVVVEMVDDLEITSRLVSWQIARARGRVRAQIGTRVGAPNLAGLLVRLSSGPQPGPPTDAAADEAASGRLVRENWGGAGTVARPKCVILHGSTSAETAARSAGLADHLEAAGVEVTTESVIAAGAVDCRNAALVVLAGVDRSPAVTELIAARRAQDLPTVSDLETASFAGSDERGAGTALVVSPAALQLAIDCGDATAPTEPGRAALRAAGVRALALPTMLTRAHAKALRTAAADAPATGGTSIGWHLGGSDESVPGYVGAVGEGIAKLLTDRPDLRVEIVGPAQRVPGALRRSHRVAVLPEAEPETIAAWDLHLWTPRIAGADAMADIRNLVEASFAGVPPILPAAARKRMDGFAGNEIVVVDHAEPEAWTDALRKLLDDDGLRAHVGAIARRWAHAVHGPTACRTSVNRLLGWVRFEEQS